MNCSDDTAVKTWGCKWVGIIIFGRESPCQSVVHMLAGIFLTL